MALHPVPERPPQQPPPPRPGTSAEGATAAQRRDHSHIHGWGADLDHRNRPAYPKERTPPRLEGLHWSRPEDQAVHTTIYHSTERPDLTPIFGTSTPPSWLSGKVRALAYRLSENDVRHWLLLLFADRINMAEGIVQDLSHGHIPNILAEMGIKAEWKYNRIGLLKKALVVSALVAGGYRLFGGRRRHQRAKIAYVEDIDLGRETLFSRPPAASTTEPSPAGVVGTSVVAAAALSAALILLSRLVRR